jgi:hypothetical protein
MRISLETSSPPLSSGMFRPAATSTRAVMSLLQAFGMVSVRHDGKVAVKIGPEREFLEPPAA